jgi:hypothetical protein
VSFLHRFARHFISISIVPRKSLQLLHFLVGNSGPEQQKTAAEQWETAPVTATNAQHYQRQIRNILGQIIN